MGVEEVVVRVDLKVLEDEEVVVAVDLRVLEDEEGVEDVEGEVDFEMVMRSEVNTLGVDLAVVDS